jgi:dTDP-L-rhamnose 4-epimerase
MRQNFPINIYEDSQATRDFIFVNDVVKLCQLALSCRHENLVINVGVRLANKVIDLAQNLKSLWNSDGTIKVTGDFSIGDIRHNRSDLTACYKKFQTGSTQPYLLDLKNLLNGLKLNKFMKTNQK